MSQFLYRSRKYPFNDCLFDKIDDEKSAYALGLFITDGCLTNSGISFSSKDYSQILLFRTIFQSEAPIRRREQNNHVYFEIVLSSIHLSETISNLRGKSKTNNGDFSFIPNKYIHHFIRGVFDGDGCVRIKNKNMETPQLSFDICGTYALLDFIKKNIDSGINKQRPTNIHSHGNIYRIIYSGNCQCQKIYNYLYKDAIYYLLRKRLIFKNQ